MTTTRPPAQKKRRVILTVRLTTDEAKCIRAAADARQTTVAVLVRECLSAKSVPV